ncbi:MAG TPA: cytochrome c4 [Burkholderiaceae bacterium]|nr:cytochrome c4 [Burkholderiaceae bacterium]
MPRLALLDRWPPLAVVLGLSLPSAAAIAAPPVPDTVAQRALACTACHGREDRERQGSHVPRLSGKPEGYLFEQMRNFRDGRRIHQGMARLMEHLDDRYLRELAAHFAEQQPLRPAAQAAAPDAPVRARAERWLREGDHALGIPPCTACHGEALTGVAPDVPGLLGLPAAYVSAQLGAWRQGLRKARTPDCMARIAQALPMQDIPALAHTLAAQPLPAAPRAASAAPGPWPMECGSVTR